MAGNTVMTAKNSFLKGLLMDFSPENTSAETLTSALNATFITFNGNEGSLLNDMGNGRVETAYLPEGYIPVGTCEFGDIIYIVSYNPLIDKALIGCFPSPERNFSSEELKLEPITLLNNEFLDYDYLYYQRDENGEFKQINKLEKLEFIELDDLNSAKDENNYVKIKVLSGKLKQSSTRKILYKLNLNPGDLYIITYDTTANALEYVTDYNTTTRKLNGLPKFLNIKVVSIEDNGKMTVLDSNVKWYEADSNKYFKFFKYNDTNEKIDLDSYRSVVSSAYNIYSSKVSGKLALLIELEKISNFSCSWEALSKGETNKEGILCNIYDIYLNYSWETSNENINPKYVILNESNLEYNSSDDFTKYSNIVTIPSKYNYSNNKTSLHTFSRLYAPEENENLDINQIEKLYTTQIKDYLNGETGILKKSGNQPGDIVQSLKHELNESGYVFDNSGNALYLINATTYSCNEECSYKNANGNEINPVAISDDVVNNTFKTLVRKHLHTFYVPKDAVNLNYRYKVCPAMPYGMLEEYAIEDTILLDKLGTTNIQVKDWRYYAYSNLLTLTWGLDAYIEPGKDISEVALEFYDNCGIVAAYHAKNYNSYNGTFTVNIPLNTKNSILNNIAGDGRTPFVHAGKLVFGEIEKVNDIQLPIYQRNTNERQKDVYGNDLGFKYNESKTKIGDRTYYYDDSGVLYPNLLYLVKIVVKVSGKLSTGLFIESLSPKVFYRWLWTNSLFNDKYYSVTDFDYIQPVFNLSLHCDYSTKSSKDDGLVEWKTIESDNRIINTGTNLVPSYHILEIRGDDGNIKIKPTVWLTNNYETFSLNLDSFLDMNAIISFAEESIENTPEQPVIQYYNGVIPGANLAINELDQATFSISPILNNSEYAVDVKLNLNTDKVKSTLKLSKYGKFI